MPSNKFLTAEQLWQLKQIVWNAHSIGCSSEVMGIQLNVYLNNGKYDACLTNGRNRPEIVTGFSTLEEAVEYAKDTLLKQELKKYFTGVKNDNH